MVRCCLWVILLAGAASAQQPDPPPPPPPAAKAEAAMKGGDVPSSFRTFLVWDQRFDKADVRNRTDKPHCLVVSNGLNPVVAVFARKIPKAADDPLNALAKDLNQAALDRKESGFAANVAFLVLPDELQFDKERDAAALAAKDFATQANIVRVPVGLAEKKSKATAAWKLDGDKDDQVTVIFYNRLGVVDRWSFPDGTPTDEDRKAILAAIQKEVPAKK